MDTLQPNELFFSEFESKMSNRFFFRLGDTGVPQYLIKAAGRPNYSFNVIEFPHINTTRKAKGKVSFDSVSLTLYDPISPSGSQYVMDWVRQHHEATTGRDGYASTYKQNLTYNSLGPAGTKVEQWKLHGAFVESVDFSDGDWENDTPSEITLSVAYDYPVQEF